MKATVMATVLVWAAAPCACLAANANNPYGNVDRRNDAGNDTGDSQVERLNEAQLGGGPQAGWRGRQQAYGGAARPYAGAYGYPPPGRDAPAYAYRPAYRYAPAYPYPPPGYYAPPPGYAASPGYAYVP